MGDQSKVGSEESFSPLSAVLQKIYHLSQRLRVQNASSARNSVSFETNLMICNEIPCEQWILSGMDS